MTVNVSQVEDQVGRSVHSGSEGSILHPWGHYCASLPDGTKDCQPRGECGGERAQAGVAQQPCITVLEVSVLERMVCGGCGEPQWTTTLAPGVWIQAMPCHRQRRILVCS